MLCFPILSEKKLFAPGNGRVGWRPLFFLFLYGPKTELQEKHHAKRKMETKIRKLAFDLKRTISDIIFNAIIYHLTIVIKI